MKAYIIFHQCAACDSTSSYRNNWHNHDGYTLCNTCFHRYVMNPVTNPIYNPINNPKNGSKHMFFKPLGKQILLKSRILKGKCQKCKKSIGDTYINKFGKEAKIRLTHTHHKKYDINNPTKHTKELCASCHGKIRK